MPPRADIFCDESYGEGLGLPIHHDQTQGEIQDRARARAPLEWQSNGMSRHQEDAAWANDYEPLRRLASFRRFFSGSVDTKLPE